LLSPAEPCPTHHTISTKAPISGTRNSSIHQPLRPVSCKRRIDTARLGSKVATAKVSLNGETSVSDGNSTASRIPVTAVQIMVNSTQYQNSMTEVRPENLV